MSIFNAVENAKAEGEVRKQTGTPFKLANYVVGALNQAYREGHKVKPSRRRLKANRSEDQRRHDQLTHRQKIQGQIDEYRRTGKLAG